MAFSDSDQSYDEGLRSDASDVRLSGTGTGTGVGTPRRMVQNNSSVFSRRLSQRSEPSKRNSLPLCGLGATVNSVSCVSNDIETYSVDTSEKGSPAMSPHSPPSPVVLPKTRSVPKLDLNPISSLAPPLRIGGAACLTPSCSTTSTKTKAPAKSEGEDTLVFSPTHAPSTSTFAGATNVASPTSVLTPLTNQAMSPTAGFPSPTTPDLASPASPEESRHTARSHPLFSDDSKHKDVVPVHGTVDDTDIASTGSGSGSEDGNMAVFSDTDMTITQTTVTGAPLEFDISRESTIPVDASFAKESGTFRQMLQKSARTQPRPNNDNVPFETSDAAKLQKAIKRIAEQEQTIERLTREKAQLTDKVRISDEQLQRVINQQADVMGRLNQEIEIERSKSPRGTPRGPGCGTPPITPADDKNGIADLKMTIASKQTEICDLKEVVQQMKMRVHDDVAESEAKVRKAKEELEKLEVTRRDVEKEQCGAQRKRVDAQKECEELEAKVKSLKDRHGKLEDEVADMDRRLKKERLLRNRGSYSKEKESQDPAQSNPEQAAETMELQRANTRLSTELADLKTEHAWVTACLDRLGITTPLTGSAISPALVASAKLRMEHLEPVSVMGK